MGDDLRYPVLVQRVEAGDVVEYSATVPDLPGCVGAGDSPEEAIACVRDSVKLWLDEAKRKGQPIPEPRRHSGRFTVRVPVRVHAQLETLATLEGVSLNQYVSSVLSSHVAAVNVPAVPRVMAAATGAAWIGTPGYGNLFPASGYDVMPMPVGGATKRLAPFQSAAAFDPSTLGIESLGTLGNARAPLEQTEDLPLLDHIVHLRFQTKVASS